MKKNIYSTRVSSKGGRNGRIKSENNSLDTEIRKPVGMGGGGNLYLNPETLFAAAYAASFNSTLESIIKEAEIRTGPTKVIAEVGVFKYGFSYNLNVKLEAEIPGINAENARVLLNKAHMACPYSIATRGNIEVKLILKEHAN